MHVNGKYIVYDRQGYVVIITRMKVIAERQFLEKLGHKKKKGR